MLNSADVLVKMREHIERNGITGANATYRPNIKVCPRGLVQHFTGQRWQSPNEVGRQALAALDAASAYRDPRHSVEPKIPGALAEGEAERIQMNATSEPEQRQAGVKFIDRALELVA